MFILVISGTEVCKIPGISVAGSNPEVIPFTAPADADMVLWGKPQVIDVIPVDPEGHPTPAIITRAAYCEAGFPVLVVRVGTYLPPVVPYVEMNGDPGKDPRYETAVPRAEELWKKAKSLGEQLGKVSKRMVIAESLPGGTTTAFLVLRALGYNGMVSSASPVNPISLKERVWEEAARRLKIQNGEMEGRGRLAAMELGDPMQITVAGMIAGLTEDVDITLAGGTQMLAVAAVARQSGMSRPLRVATTRYVAEDRNAHFRELAKKIKVDTFEAQLNFSHSPFPGLADYEKGFVKEGVGAGGAVWYAEQLGVPVSRVIQKTESIYQDMMH